MTFEGYFWTFYILVVAHLLTSFFNQLLGDVCLAGAVITVCIWTIHTILDGGQNDN